MKQVHFGVFFFLIHTVNREGQKKVGYRAGCHLTADIRVGVGVLGGF